MDEQDLMNPAYWDYRYAYNQTGWDVGYATPPISEYVKQLKNKDKAVLIPGCGNGYEAGFMLQQGFTHIHLLDFSSEAVKHLQSRFEKYKPQIKIIQADFFNYQGQYDLVLEQTFITTVSPERRKAFAQKIADLVKPGGTYAGVFFNLHFDVNPPYGGSVDEYIALFSEHFIIKSIEPCCNSIIPRKGEELFFIFIRKALH